MSLKKCFVIFFSPGTFCAEQSEKPIDDWDINIAVKMARKIKERYNATPYGFCFTTRERKDDELDSKEVKRSAMYYLGGEVLTLEQIKARNDPTDKILISNMECNGWKKVVDNRNSWRWTQPLRDGDVVVPFEVEK